MSVHEMMSSQLVAWEDMIKEAFEYAASHSEWEAITEMSYDMAGEVNALFFMDMASDHTGAVKNGLLETMDHLMSPLGVVCQSLQVIVDGQERAHARLLLNKGTEKYRWIGFYNECSYYLSCIDSLKMELCINKVWKTSPAQDQRLSLFISKLKFLCKQALENVSQDYVQ